jgi:hypothetical protein
MSKENVQKVVGSILTDKEFAKSFFENPDKVLKDYELTADEIAGLKAMKQEDASKFSGGLDERISKMMRR